MEDYLRRLQKELKGFPPDERSILIDEIRSHIESGETDPALGRDPRVRRSKLMKELGTAQEMSNRFRALYRPGRFIDYLLMLIPFLCYPYLNTFYANIVMPRYAGGALLLDIFIHLPLVFIGLWRRSAALTLFWSAILISQVSYICGRLYWYYGFQTILWAILLIGLLYLAGKTVWENRRDPIIVAFALVMVGMSIAGSLINSASLADPFQSVIWRRDWILGNIAAYRLIDRSLLEVYIRVRDVAEFYSVLTLGLFFLPSSRGVRWMGLALSGLIMGLGHRYLLDTQVDQNLMAPWIYVSWVILPLIIVALGWLVERNKGEQVQLAV